MNRRHLIACFAALAVVACAPDEPEPEPPRPTERRFVLVGQGCGPDKEIMVFREEDEFPWQCETIDAHWLDD